MCVGRAWLGNINLVRLTYIRVLHGHTAAVYCAAVDGHRYEQTLMNYRVAH